MSEHYDVLVIGGGIHGAGVAQAAAVAGYSVLVLEQNELASGTSSRSSKLIHGGLRYLEHGEFSLVRECLHERSLLLKNAPGLVKLKPFYIPVYRHSSRSALKIRAGLTLYALLASLFGGRQHASFKSLSRQQWGTLDGLKTENLKAVFQYWDAQTDDVALTKAVMASAQQYGAEVKTSTEFLAANLREDQCEVHFRQHQHQQSYTCTAKVIVNAAGPWVNEVLARVTPAVEPFKMDLVQGAHLIVEGKISKGMYYLESVDDQRPVFVMPWFYQAQGSDAQRKDAILIGTTENTYVGNPSAVQPLQSEQDYLLNVYRYYFSKPAKILSSFAGLRVLPVDETQHGTRSRETILHPDRNRKPRLVSIYGGKLTAYRATAEKIMRCLAVSLPDRHAVADTRTIKLG